MGPTYEVHQAPELQNHATEEDWLVVQHLPQRGTNGTLHMYRTKMKTPEMKTPEMTMQRSLQRSG